MGHKSFGRRFRELAKFVSNRLQASVNTSIQSENGKTSRLFWMCACNFIYIWAFDRFSASWIAKSRPNSMNPSPGELFWAQVSKYLRRPLVGAFCPHLTQYLVFRVTQVLHIEAHHFCSLLHSIGLTGFWGRNEANQASNYCWKNKINDYVS